jgi:6-phosphogluconolactonase
MPDIQSVHVGSSIHPTRQRSPHPHQALITPDLQSVCVTDLGTDEIYIYDRHLVLRSKVNAIPGSGPRHMSFSARGYLYCVNELSATIDIYDYQAGQLTLCGSVNTSQIATATCTPSAIRISADQRFLFVANRGVDTISSFSIYDKSLVFIEEISCGGKNPRDFNLTNNGELLLCANESSGNIAVFKLQNGRMSLIQNHGGYKHPFCIAISNNAIVS